MLQSTFIKIVQNQEKKNWKSLEFCFWKSLATLSAFSKTLPGLLKLLEEQTNVTIN